MRPYPGDGAIYLHRITPDDLIEFVNDAWVRFAEDNGAALLPREVIGTPLWRHVAGPGVVQLSMQLAAKARQTGSEVSVPFRCDSPSARRFMRMNIVPLGQGRVEFRTWVEREEAFRVPARLLDPGAPKDTEELVRMCAWCKRIDEDGAWLELEDALERLGLFGRPTMPAITHGICEDCLTRMRV